MSWTALPDQQKEQCGGGGTGTVEPVWGEGGESWGCLPGPWHWQEHLCSQEAWFSRSQELLSCAKERWGALQHLPVPAGFLLACLTFNLKIKAQLSVTLHHERNQKTLRQRPSFLGLQAAFSEKIENYYFRSNVLLMVTVVQISGIFALISELGYVNLTSS